MTRRLRPVMYVIGTFVLAAFMAACAATDTDDAAEAEAPEDSAPELDLDTLSAETDEGTLQAEPWGDTYVGAVNEDLYVGISLPEGAEAEGPQEARVYLCDGEEIGASLSGEIGPEAMTLEGETHEGEESEDLTVELSLNDAVSGAVTVGSGEPQPFEATEAGGDAGVYTAETTFDGEDHHWGGWVVLPDGSQRGFYCCSPPFASMPIFCPCDRHQN